MSHRRRADLIFGEALHAENLEDLQPVTHALRDQNQHVGAAAAKGREHAERRIAWKHANDFSPWRGQIHQTIDRRDRQGGFDR